MATSFNPFGFLPARKRDGQPNSEGYGQIVQPVSNSAIGIVSLLPNDIYAGDLIVIDTAGPVPVLLTTIFKVFQTSGKVGSFWVTENSRKGKDAIAEL